MSEEELLNLERRLENENSDFPLDNILRTDDNEVMELQNINNLEERLNIKQTSISYSLGAPLINTHFKQIPINRKNLKNNLHYNQVDLIQ